MTTLTEAFRKGIVQVGDSFKFPMQEKEIHIMEGEKTGFLQEQFLSNKSPMDFRLYADSQLYLIPSNPTQLLGLGGKIGYENGIDMLNYVCKELYSSPLAIQVTHITEKDCKDFYPKCSVRRACWLATRSYHEYEDLRYFGLKTRYFYNDVERCDLIINYTDGSIFDEINTSKLVLPKIQLYPDIIVDNTAGDGSEENPWILKTM